MQSGAKFTSCCLGQVECRYSYAVGRQVYKLVFTPSWVQLDADTVMLSGAKFPSCCLGQVECRYSYAVGRQVYKLVFTPSWVQLDADTVMQSGAKFTSRCLSQVECRYSYAFGRQVYKLVFPPSWVQLDADTVMQSGAKFTSGWLGQVGCRYSYAVGHQEKLSSNLPAIADNVAVINGTDLSPLYERTDVRRVTETISSSTTTTFEAPVVGSLTVAQLPTMQPIETMIGAGQIQTSVNGVVVQNGLATPQAHTRAATGEEVPQNIVVTTRQQYGLPDASVVYCNFNQLYKIDPATLKMWVNVSAVAHT
ncbi:hypothetical protein QYM36_011018 [Artemia franciscana]|uniref:O-GlcNAc transferase C-terminal domain-containing protein n=1 Tax=Artemia franciscana TaxID=6661 RepID=A0AA88HXV7_ARTSF|nr:hypothetical protein QYM36_011018 [Artemia franciscana]